ncbi:hypothetical protein DERP_009514 [Dermatophagoides pteronyssinus]|uniref:Protein PsiE n=1 Tax=Dermatophagoides pteronyssinus TaxID=6956 RepID=A0ABQ8IUD3_DERPT|nr:hypothetical protein DERP_009514 [Dermatophagoides pteronyssinus]
MAQFFGFSCRKWTIIVLCSFLIVAKIIELITIFSHKNEIVPKNDDKTIIALVVYEIITIATILIGLFGAIKENFYLSITFCIIFSYILIRMIINLFNNVKFAYEIIVMATLIFSDILFVFELYGSKSTTTVPT